MFQGSVAWIRNRALGLRDIAQRCPSCPTLRDVARQSPASRKPATIAQQARNHSTPFQQHRHSCLCQQHNAAGSPHTCKIKERVLSCSHFATTTHIATCGTGRNACATYKEPPWHSHSLSSIPGMTANASTSPAPSPHPAITPRAATRSTFRNHRSSLPRSPPSTAPPGWTASLVTITSSCPAPR
jgi:hypothetical protein